MSIRLYGMLKNPRGMNTDTCEQNSPKFLAKFLPTSLLDVSAAARALVGESGMIRTQTGRTIDQ